MERAHIALLQLVLLAIAITSGEATKNCYQCTSVDPKCNDPFDKSALQPTECTPQSVSKLLRVGSDLVDGILDTFGKQPGGSTPEIQWTCLKSETKMPDGAVMVVRTCNIPKSDSVDVCAVKTGEKSLFCGVCDTDGCNSAVRLGGVSALFYLLVPCLVALKAIAA